MTFLMSENPLALLLALCQLVHVLELHMEGEDI